MKEQRSVAEVEADISAAFHDGSQNSRIRELQAEQQEILGHAQLAEYLRAEALALKERGE